jgi:hypothetical protein
VSENALPPLRKEAPPLRADFIDGVMRKVAARPVPRPSFWHRLFAERELTLRVRPASLCLVAGGALALMVFLWLRPAPQPLVTLQSSTPLVRSEPKQVTVRFAVMAPHAHAVALAGDFNGWRADATPLRHGDGDAWFAEVPLSPGTFRYAFVVDGKWIEDPLADGWRSDGFGGRNSVVRVAATEIGSGSGG